MISKEKMASYGFRFQENSTESIANLWNVGWESRDNLDYDWDGNLRNEEGSIVFQYTLSGMGMLELEGKRFEIRENQAFLVRLPSNHRYYFPGGDVPWEFIYITMYGREATRIWEYVSQKGISVFEIPPNSELIRVLISIYDETRLEKIKDSYYASAWCYKFLMECWRFLKHYSKPTKTSVGITSAIHYMENLYYKPLSLEEIAEHCRISKYALIKQFKHQLHTTPIQYLTNLRIRKAVHLLRDTNKTMDEIAQDVGFTSGNYFNKVFKKVVGVSAGSFRDSKNYAPVDYIVTE